MLCREGKQTFLKSCARQLEQALAWESRDIRVPSRREAGRAGSGEFPSPAQGGGGSEWKASLSGSGWSAGEGSQQMKALNFPGRRIEGT